jgi:hypothetical protein
MWDSVSLLLCVLMLSLARYSTQLTEPSSLLPHSKQPTIDHYPKLHKFKIHSPIPQFSDPFNIFPSSARSFSWALCVLLPKWYTWFSTVLCMLHTLWLWVEHHLYKSTAPTTEGGRHAKARMHAHARAHTHTQIWPPHKSHIFQV